LDCMRIKQIAYREKKKQMTNGKKREWSRFGENQ